jgi:DNA-binding NarL/FixJ family response regulator
MAFGFIPECRSASLRNQRSASPESSAGSLKSWKLPVIRCFLHGTAGKGTQLAENHTLDVLITDPVMPEVERLELIQKIKRDHPDLKIIAMSGIFGEDVLRAAELLGADITLRKPLTGETLIEAIRGL